MYIAVSAPHREQIPLHRICCHPSLWMSATNFILRFERFPVFIPDPFLLRFPMCEAYALAGNARKCILHTRYLSGQAMKLSRYSDREIFIPFTNPYPQARKNKLSEKFLFCSSHNEKAAVLPPSLAKPLPVCFSFFPITLLEPAYLLCPSLIWLIIFKPGTAFYNPSSPTPSLHMLAGLKILHLLYAEPFCHAGKPSSPCIHKFLLIIDHHKGHKAQFQQSINAEQVFLHTAPVVCQYIYLTMSGYL